MNVERITDLNEIYFPKLGWRFHIDPTAFTIGNFSIQWYGIIITVGLILALVYCFPKMRRFGLDADRTIDAVIGGVIGGIIGARAYYVIFNWDEYKGRGLKAIVDTRQGGLAIYGGIIGAIAVGLLICKIRKVKFLPMLDITVLGFLIGQGIGRWGNFVNQEAFGTKCSNLFCMTGGTVQRYLLDNSTHLDGDLILNGYAVGEYEAGNGAIELFAVHPCFLYESLWCLLGFLILSTVSKHRKFDGQILLMYLAWYGAERFVVEGLRTDSLYIGNIRVSQALSAVLFITSVILLIVMFFRRKRDPESFVLYANTKESRQLIEESRRRRMGVPLEDIHLDDDDDFVPDDSDDDDDEDSDILGDDDDDEDDTTEDEDETDDDETSETKTDEDDESDEDNKEE